MKFTKLKILIFILTSFTISETIAMEITDTVKERKKVYKPVLVSQNDEIPMPGDSTDSVSKNESNAVPMPGEDNDLDTSFYDNSSSQFLNNKTEFSGYIENTLNLEEVKAINEIVPLNITRARLNLNGNPVSEIDFALGIIGILNSGKTNIKIDNYIPKVNEKNKNYLNDKINLNLLKEMTFNLENKLYIQEAFVTLYFSSLKIRTGRQKFYTGTGYAFNPIDLFNQKNALDPTYETDGIDSLLIEYELPLDTQLQIFTKLSQRFFLSDYLIKLKSSIGNTDLGLQYSQNIQKKYADKGVMYKHSLLYKMFAAQFVTELLGIGFHGEGGYVFSLDYVNTFNYINNESSKLSKPEYLLKKHERFLLGFDYTFDFQLYVIAEYLRTGNAKNDISEITIADRLSFLEGDIIAINQDTLFTGLSYPLTDLSEFSIYFLTGLNDSSLIINPWIMVDLHPGVKLSFTMNIPKGDEKTQLGIVGYSGFARIKINY